VYILLDEEGRALYVGKAINLRRRLRAHFAGRRWKAIKTDMSRAANAEWIEVGSELEALLREAALIQELQPIANVQIGPPGLATRDLPRAVVRDVLVIVPSIESDSVELVGARLDGAWLIQRTRRNGADLAVHTDRLMRFFLPPARREIACGPASAPPRASCFRGSRRGSDATRLDPHDASSRRGLRVVWLRCSRTSGCLPSVWINARHVGVFKSGSTCVHSKIRSA
jgi:predicted GIY-YIG superfamily endonuclease